MSQQYERTISCKNTGPQGELCGAEIGLFNGKWYDTKSDIMHTKVCKYPRKFERRSTFPPKQQVDEALVSEINTLKEDVESMKEAIRALVAENSFRKANGEQVGPSN